ncbi:MAG: LTA synthase family protein [Bdellovibrionales bacterium]|nr:LTA synthase family protein [Bdellovibrionales bacterium]
MAAKKTSRWAGLLSERGRWIDIHSPDWFEWFVALVLMYFSFVLLRMQLVTDLDLTYSEALTKGLFMGLLQDLLAVSSPLAISMILASAFNLPRRITWSVLAVGIWIATAANVMYFKFFGDPLQLWVLQNHLKDLTSVQGAATNLALALPVVFSALLVLIMLAFMAFSYHREPKMEAKRARRLKLQTGVGGAVVLVLVLVLRYSPDWMMRNFHDRLPWTVKGSVLSDQVLTLWWDQVYDRADWRQLLSRRTPTAPAPRDVAERDRVQQALAEYRDLNRRRPVKATRASEGWPLVHEIGMEPAETRALRARLGLPVKGPVNVVYLFIESGRFYEMAHPKWGRTLFPELNAIMDKSAVTFTQTYTVARSAAQTVRGMFSALCSTMENIPGPATFLAYPDLRIRCLQDLAAAAGYQTAWSHSYPRSYHNMGYFETRHGTQELYDQQYFLEAGVPRRKDDWGIEDGPFLSESLKAIQALHAKKRPFFISLLTASSHYPWSVLPDVELPRELVDLVKASPDYHGYLTRLHYVDQSLGEFFREFFKSPAADNTLVVVLADHSTNITPPFVTDPVVAEEIRFRIPMIFVTKNQRRPERIHQPVHQMDLTPTVATLAGLGGEVSWIGRDVFSDNGTPWTYEKGSQILYRVGARACYTPDLGTQPKCYRVGEGRDPLFDGATLDELPEDRAQSEMFRKLIDVNTRAITGDLIFP